MTGILHPRAVVGLTDEATKSTTDLTRIADQEETHYMSIDWNPVCMKIIDDLIECETGRVLVLDSFTEDTVSLLNCLEPKGFSAMWLDYLNR